MLTFSWQRNYEKTQTDLNCLRWMCSYRSSFVDLGDMNFAHKFVGSDPGVRVHVCHPVNVAMAMENPPEFVDHFRTESPDFP